MRLANIESQGQPCVALVLEGECVNLTSRLGAQLDDVPKLLARGDEARALVDRCVKSAAPRLPLECVKFRSPVACPDKIPTSGESAASQIGSPMNRASDEPWMTCPRAESHSR